MGYGGKARNILGYLAPQELTRGTLRSQTSDNAVENVLFTDEKAACIAIALDKLHNPFHGYCSTTNDVGAAGVEPGQGEPLGAGHRHQPLDQRVPAGLPGAGGEGLFVGVARHRRRGQLLDVGEQRLGEPEDGLRVEPGAGHLVAVEPARGELADLEERRAGVEQPLNPLARQQLAARDMLCARGLAAALGAGVLLTGLGATPALASPAHPAGWTAEHGLPGGSFLVASAEGETGASFGTEFEVDESDVRLTVAPVLEGDARGAETEVPFTYDDELERGDFDVAAARRSLGESGTGPVVYTLSVLGGEVAALTYGPDADLTDADPGEPLRADDAEHGNHQQRHQPSIGFHRAASFPSRMARSCCRVLRNGPSPTAMAP